MKRVILSLVATLCLATHLFAQGQGLDSLYTLGPDSLPRDKVPHGKIVGPFKIPSQVFPGTSHTYWVHVPAQYDAKKAASLMIFNDGQAFMDANGSLRAQNVLDNLMYRRELPVLITVFINPGHTPEQPEPTPKDWGDKTTNRGTEYNAVNDKYARVVVDELLPALYKEYNISKDPDQHGIAGASSGGIAAFGVAWYRPDEFRKVISIVGSFTNLRGGYVFPEMVMESDKKPIRAFFQDGRNDNRNADPKRDWFYQNVRLVDALTKKGYEVNYAWGIGLHGQKMGGAILPEMMRWLWRDHPVSTNVNDTMERSFRAAVPTVEAAPAQEKQ